MTDQSTAVQKVPCCPELKPCGVCDQLDFRYRLRFQKSFVVSDEVVSVPVEVTLLFRLTRCAGPLSLGDLLYTTTLLPGEKVQLFTSDRHTRFTYDSETKLSYRQETTSEESYFMAGMAYTMSNLSILDTTNSSSSFGQSSVSGGGGAGLDLGIFSIGGGASGSSYNANAAANLAHQLSQHADSSSKQLEVATHAAASTSIGEVATRTHQQGESEDQYESSSRTFSNPNQCHAVTFFFYRINKCQTLRFELVSIERRVDDATAPTGVELNPPQPATQVAVASSLVLSTAKDRLDVAQRAQSAVAVEQGSSSPSGFAMAGAQSTSGYSVAKRPIPVDIQKAALAQVEKELMGEGLLDKNGDANPDLVKKLSWERKMALPTPGVLVKGCLDDCSICEPALQQKIALELDRMKLENDLLQKKIFILEKSQEYRCCPEGDETPPAAPTP